MNPQIEQLYQISKAPTRTILGLMSGTSLDGLDLALVRFTGFGLDTSYEILHYDTRPYPADFKESIRSVFAKENIHFPTLSTLNAQIGRLHASLILEVLASWDVDVSEVDAIASHGQTVMHRPDRTGKLPHSTMQIGDGDHIAHLTGIITLSDFRQRHVAAGGEGAPLAMFGDYFLFSKKGEHRILLNIGGIGNFTYLPASGDPAGILVTDTGPGNTLIDAAVRRYFNQAYDEDGAIAHSGKIDAGILAELLSLSFFKDQFPKSTGPEYFNLDIVRASISPADLVATLTEFTAQSIALAMKTYIPSGIDGTVYVSGGGCKNPVIMARLAELLPFRVCESDELGMPSAAKEAVLFALLANETLADSPGAERLGDSPWESLGKISL
jgi:anhydro-N-acetylmuramic acid kinase